MKDSIMEDSIKKDSIREYSITDIIDEEEIIKRFKPEPVTASIQDLIEMVYPSIRIIGKKGKKGKKITSPMIYYMGVIRPIHLSVLLVIAVNGPRDAYAVTRLIKKKSYSQGHDAMIDLKKMGFLKSEKPEKSKTNVKKIPYSLTKYGLCKLLLSGTGIYTHAYEDPIWKRCIDTIIDHWKPLAPFIFNRWDDLLKKGLREEAIEVLHDAMYSVALHSKWLDNHPSVKVQHETSEIDAAFIEQVASDKEISMEKWIAAIRKDKDLSDLAIRTLKGRFNSDAHMVIHHVKAFERYEIALKKIGGDKTIDELWSSFQEAMKEALTMEGSTETEREIFILIMTSMSRGIKWSSHLDSSATPRSALLEEAEDELFMSLMKKEIFVKAHAEALKRNISLQALLEEALEKALKKEIKA